MSPEERADRQPTADELFAALSEEELDGFARVLVRLERSALEREQAGLVDVERAS